MNIADKKNIVQKLKTQCAHPPASKLIKLTEEGGFKDEKALKNEIKNMSETCEICNIYCGPNSIPVVGLSIATV